MKRFLPVAALFALCVWAGCCVNKTVRHPETRIPLINELKSNTVALMARDEDGDMSPYCTGVWIDRDQILTANHCIFAQVLVASQQTLVAQPDMSESDEQAFAKQIDMGEDGFQISYMVESDSQGIYRDPKTTRAATVVRHDAMHDLALLNIPAHDGVPAHGYAQLATRAPAVGDTVHIMGHVVGLTWSYSKGLVSAIRAEDLMKKGPFIQVAGPVYKGDSGGGIFNDAGELVGVVSFLAPAPDEAFCTYTDAIRSFLAER